MHILLVDHHVHAFLAMHSLRTVDPDGGGIVDLDGVCSGISGARSNEHEAREEAGDIAVHGDRLAWLVEGGLGDGVVASGELELNHITCVGLDVVGRELDRAGLGAYGDDVNGGAALRCDV
jgi:hypothetical protein